MAISLDKVFDGMDPKTWLELNKKDPNNYEVVGVHAYIYGFGNIAESFARKVPENAEAAFYNPRIAISSNGQTLQLAPGTALIPKKDKQQKPFYKRIFRL